MVREAIRILYATCKKYYHKIKKQKIHVVFTRTFIDSLKRIGFTYKEIKKLIKKNDAIIKCHCGREMYWIGPKGRKTLLCLKCDWLEVYDLNYWVKEQMGDKF